MGDYLEHISNRLLRFVLVKIETDRNFPEWIHEREKEVLLLLNAFTQIERN